MRQPIENLKKAIASTAVILSGCSIGVSDRVSIGGPQDADHPARAQLLATYSLPRKVFTVTVKGKETNINDETNPGFEIDDKATKLVPDPHPEFRYEFWYVPSALAKDAINVSTSNQMLSTVTISSDDQTGAILADLAKSLGAIRGLQAPGGLRTVGGDAAGEKTLATLQIDPTDPTSVRAAQRALGRNATLTVRPAPRPVTVAPSCDFALCYRPLISVTMSFRETKTGQVTEFTEIVPDPHQVTGIDVQRSAFVKRDTILTFTDGTLTKVDLTKPSEVAGAALLPLTIITAFFEGTNQAVNALVGSKKNTSDKSIELLNAQANYLEALAKYQDRVNATNAKINPDAPPANGTTPVPQ